MKNLIILVFLLSLCTPLFSQVYDVIPDENGEPFGIKVFDGESFHKYKLDKISSDNEYEIKLGDKILQLDFSHWMNQDMGLQSDQKVGIPEIFEPGLIPEGDLLRDLVFSPDGTILAALYQHSDNVFFYNTSNFDILAIVNMGLEPMDIKLTDQYAYTCCHKSNEVYIIDLSDYSVSNSFEVFYEPCQIEVNQDESIVYVACHSFLDGSVAAYNSNSGDVIFHTWDPFIHYQGSGGSTGRTSYRFTEFALSPNDNYIVAINTSGQAPSVFSATNGELVKTFNFGGGFRGSGFSVTGDTMYMYCTQHPDSMSMHRIDINDLTVIDSIIAITTESGMIGTTDLAISQDGSKVLTVDNSWNSQYCIFDFKSHTYQYIFDDGLFGHINLYTTYDRKYAISQVFLHAKLIKLETGEIINRTPVGLPIGLAGNASPADDKVALSDGPFYSLPEFPDEKFYQFDFSDHLNFTTDSIIYSGSEPEADMTNCAVLSTDGNKLIATNTLSDNISIIDFSTGQLDTLISMDGVSVVVAVPNRDFVMVAGKDAISTNIIDMTNYEIIADIPTGNADALFVTEDGEEAYAFQILSSELASIKKIEISGASSQIVDELLVSHSNCSWHLVMHEVDRRTTIALSPDGNYIILGAIDNSIGDVVHIVDTQIMEIVATLGVSNDCIYDYAFTDDSKRVCALTKNTQVHIINLDGANSFVESDVFLEDYAFSVEYNPFDDLFYIVLKSNLLYQVNPYTGEILETTLVLSWDYSWQVGIDQDGDPFVRGSENIVYLDESFTLPGVSLDFSYNADHNLFVIPVPGPDKVCVFDPLSVGINTYPVSHRSESVSVYPNPANEIVFISSGDIIENVKIMDSQGKFILSKDYNSRNVSVSVKDYQDGTYFVVVKDAESTSSNKLIIAHQ